MPDLTLYTYFRSSAAFRVRIALALKGLTYESRFVHLLRDGGEQHRADYLELNPQALVPTVIAGETVLNQSLAIVEYLNEVYPSPPLLPAAPDQRAQVRAMAQIIACDTHPLQNLRVRNYLQQTLGQTDHAVDEWCRHWIAAGLRAVEQHVRRYAEEGEFAFGSSPTLADVCLVPQVYNAERYECPLDELARVRAVYETCMTLPAFQNAVPERQPDAGNSAPR
jgi:maleylacetoacetate isomerase